MQQAISKQSALHSTSLLVSTIPCSEVLRYNLSIDALHCISKFENEDVHSYCGVCNDDAFKAPPTYYDPLVNELDELDELGMNKLNIHSRLFGRLLSSATRGQRMRTSMALVYSKFGQPENVVRLEECRMCLVVVT